MSNAHTAPAATLSPLSVDRFIVIGSWWRGDAINVEFDTLGGAIDHARELTTAGATVEYYPIRRTVADFPTSW